MLFHEFGEDGVSALKLGFELLDFTGVGVLDGLALAAIVESVMAVFEKLLEPGVDLVGVEAKFVAEVGDGNLLDEVAFEDGDLFGAGEVATLLGHGEPPVWVMLTRTERSSRF